jgi:hypothetical protein
MGRTARSAAGARSASRAARLARARQRREEMDKGRKARDERIELAAAEVYEAQEERDEAAGALELAEVRMGEAITRILAEGVAIAQVAELTDLSVGQVQKLRAAAGQTDGAPAPDGGTGAARAPAKAAPGHTGPPPPAARPVQAAAS